MFNLVFNVLFGLFKVVGQMAIALQLSREF